jgi:hypothetical protein
MKCNGGYSSFIPVPELLIDRKIPETARLDEIEAMLKCTVCKTKGEVDLRNDPNWSSVAPGAGMTLGGRR